MTIRDTIITKLNNLPESLLQQVNEFIDLVTIKHQRKTLNDSSQADIRKFWKRWFEMDAEPQDSE